MDISSTMGTMSMVSDLVTLVRFSWIDYLLFALMFGLSVAIGIYFGCCGSKQPTTSEYLLGSRSMSVFPIAMSLTASHLSGITLLGGPAEVYVYGSQFWFCMWAGVLLSIVMVYIYLPVFYNLQVSSSYEYLKLRFDGKIRSMALILYVLATVLYIPIVVYVPSLAFSQVSGINMHLIAPMLCGICIFYTALGGLKGVVWNDAMQFSVTLASFTTVFIMGTKSAGGFWEIWNQSGKGDRLEFFNLDLDPTTRSTLWGVVFGTTFTWLASLGVNPASIQRFMAVPSLDKAKRCMLIFGVGVFVVTCITSFTGLIMYAKYKDCDPYASGTITRPDQILPYYVMDVARNIPGLSGLFISGVFSTGLSTMSTHLNTLAGTIYTDFMRAYLPENTTDTTANNIIKVIVVISGAISVAMIFVIENLGGVIQITMSFGGVTNGPLLGLFTLGMLFPSATTKGALTGSIVSLVLMLWIVIGNQVSLLTGTLRYDYLPLRTDGCKGIEETTNIINSTTSAPLICPSDEPLWLYKISFYWYTVIGTAITIGVGLIVSWLSKEQNEKRYRKELYSPVIHKYILNKECEMVELEQNIKILEDKPQSYEEATRKSVV